MQTMMKRNDRNDSWDKDKRSESRQLINQALASAPRQTTFGAYLRMFSQPKNVFAMGDKLELLCKEVIGRCKTLKPFGLRALRHQPCFCAVKYPRKLLRHR